MSDNGGSSIPEPPSIRTLIQIQLNTDGAISINGPINDKVLFLGLLEVAKDRVLEHHRKMSPRSTGIIPITKKIE